MSDSHEEQAARSRVSDWVRAHGRAVRGYLWSMTGSHDDADELYQEVFHRAWRHRHRYREEGKPIAYLLRIADRLLVDRARRRRVHTIDDDRWRAVEPSDNGELPAEKLQRQEAARRLETAMNELTPDQRRVLSLHYYGELTFREIAELTQAPLNTVLSHARRGLQRLRRIL